MLRFQLSVILSSLLLLSFSPKHDYHVSLTQLEYKPGTGSLEIAIKVFTDDLELALNLHTKQSNKLLKDFSSQHICDYVNKSFLVKSTHPIALHCLGFEEEVEVVWVYLETQIPTGTKEIEVTNKVLMEVYRDQMNLVHFKSLGKKQSFLAKASSPKGLFEIE